MDKPIAYR